MKVVDYTVPALQPDSLTDTSNAAGVTPTFRHQLRGRVSDVPRNLNQALRLDLRPFDATYISPPRRPSNLQVNDAESEGARWRNMVSRHSDASRTGGLRTGSPALNPVQIMLEMLREMQQAEDSLVAQQTAITRG